MKAASLVVLCCAMAGIALMPAPAGAATRERVIKAQSGSVRATLTFRYYSPLSKAWMKSRLRIWSGGKLIVNRAGGFGQRVAGLRLLTVRQLDGTGPPEVLLHAFSGGAHCCWTTAIYTGRHRTIQQWGHIYVPQLRDVDGDGRPEFHGFDTSFAYAFSSFGQSAFPAKVWSYSGLAVHDVTSSFPAEVQADMASQYARYQDARAAGDAGSVRSALAAYAADGYSLGQGDAAMAVVQAADAAGETQRARDRFPDYIATLRKRLRDLGYDQGVV
jgi:hypothetical protein